MMDRAQFMQELEKLLADISETERPVSYTHLDVYKRQVCKDED